MGGCASSRPRAGPLNGTRADPGRGATRRDRPDPLRRGRSLLRPLLPRRFQNPGVSTGQLRRTYGKAARPESGTASGAAARRFQNPGVSAGQLRRTYGKAARPESGTASGAAARRFENPASRLVSSDGRTAKPHVLKAAPQAVPQRAALSRHGARAVQEHVVERRAEADGERAGEDGGLAEARDLDARRVGHPLAEERANRLEEEVAVRADPAAEDDEADVRHRRDRRDMQR